MKIKPIYFILGIIAATMAYTNPSEEDHQDKFAKLIINRMVNDTTQIDEEYSEEMPEVLIDMFASYNYVGAENSARTSISRTNFVLFSTTQIYFEGGYQTTGLGIFDNVFIWGDWYLK